MDRIALIVVSSACCLLPCLAAAQRVDPVAEPMDSAKRAVVRELVTAARMREQVLQTMRETSRLQTVPVPPGFWDRMLERAAQDADTLIASTVEDYGSYFTAAELRELITFYRTPVGQRLLDVLPRIGARASVRGQTWGMRVGMEVGAELLDKPASGAKPAKSLKPVQKP